MSGANIFVNQYDCVKNKQFIKFPHNEHLVSALIASTIITKIFLFKVDGTDNHYSIHDKTSSIMMRVFLFCAGHTFF